MKEKSVIFLSLERTFIQLLLWHGSCHFYGKWKLPFENSIT